MSARAPGGMTLGWCAVCFKQYCPCPYYQHSVINRPEALACKHVRHLT